MYDSDRPRDSSYGSYGPYGNGLPKWLVPWGVLAAIVIVALLALAWLAYASFLVDVPQEHVAVLIKKTGLDLPAGQVAAPSDEYKGIQRTLLTEGRHFLNPYVWDWEVVPQVKIKEGELGVLIRMAGDELPPGEFIATKDTQKGIVREVLKSGGRYAINPMLERIEMHRPVTVPAGYKGVVTLLSGPLAREPNQILVPSGFRGVQAETLDPETYFFNPYIYRVHVVDCRSHRYNLSEEKDFGFPSKDGFWVSLDAILEFRVKPDKAAEVFVLYNVDPLGEHLYDELVRKVILPNARSFCRLEGSNSLGRELIQGDTRTKFQEKFQAEMRTACDPMGIEVIQALITDIRPPDQIALPVRNREIAKQQAKQYEQEILQQGSEAKLATERQTVHQRTALVQADQEVVQLTVEAMRQQEVSVTKGNENKSVAQFKLDASKDEAAAIVSRGKAAAEVVQLKNKAEAAGWKRAVEAFHGNGAQFAQYVMYQKMSAAYRQLMVNTADSPIMRIFDTFVPKAAEPAEKAKQ